MERFYPGTKAVQDEKTGRVFTGSSHYEARNRMENVTGRRQPATEGYQTPDGFVSKSEMHGHREP